MANFKIVHGTIDLGRDGRFGPGRESAMEKALKGRKDSKSLLDRLESRGIIVQKAPAAKKEKSTKSDKEKSDK